METFSTVVSSINNLIYLAQRNIKKKWTMPLANWGVTAQQSNTLPAHVLARIDSEMEQAAQGKTVGLEVFKEKHFLK